MDFVFDLLRSVFFTKIFGDIDLYTILSNIFKYIFVFIVLYYVYIIVRVIFLDIRTVFEDEGLKKSFLEMVEDQITDKERQKVFVLDDFNSVGRDYSNDIILQDSLVSRRHAIIIWKNDGYYLEDMKSSNGSFVNGERIDDAVKLYDGDLISFGTHSFKFNRGEEAYEEGHSE